MKILLLTIGLTGLLACGCGKKSSQGTPTASPDSSPATATANNPDTYATTYANELGVQLERLQMGYYTGRMEDSDESYKKIHGHFPDETEGATSDVSFSNFTNATRKLFWNEKARGQEPPPIVIAPGTDLYSTTFENEAGVQLMISAYGYNYAQIQDNGEDFVKQSGHYSEYPIINTHNMNLDTLTNQFVQDFWALKAKGQEPPPTQP